MPVFPETASTAAQPINAQNGHSDHLDMLQSLRLANVVINRYKILSEVVMKQIYVLAAVRACVPLLICMCGRKVRTITLKKHYVGARWSMSPALARAYAQPRRDCPKR
jgi:hypothetical protein